jgi:hypothetical protein
MVWSLHHPCDELKALQGVRVFAKVRDVRVYIGTQNTKGCAQRREMYVSYV